MANSYSTIPHRDISRGMDTKSPVNQLPDGFAEDLLNVVTNSNGSLAKRVGYRGVGQPLPVPPSSVVVSESTDDITFTWTSADDSWTADSDQFATLPPTALVWFGQALSGTAVSADSVQSLPIESITFNAGSTVLVCTLTASSDLSFTSGDLPCLVYEFSYNRTAETASTLEHLSALATYRREAESELVAVLGGHIYVFDTSAAATTSVDNTITTSNSSRTVGPAFQPVALSRDKGDIVTSAADLAGNVPCTGFAYNAGTLTYTLTTTGATDVAVQAAVTTVSESTNQHDWLTVSGMPYSELNGTFPIVSVSGGSTTTVVVTNPSVTMDVFDTLGTSGLAAINTDQIIVDAGTLAVQSGSYVRLEDSADEQLSNLLVRAAVPSADDLSTSILVLNIATGFTYEDTVDLVERSTRIVPVSTLIAAGDMVQVSGDSTWHRVLHAGSTTTDDGVSVSADGTVGTIVFDNASDADRFQIGQRVEVLGTTDFAGVHTITAVNAATSVEFASSLTESSQNGYTWPQWIELDAEVTLTSGSTITTEGRWKLVTPPTNGSDYNQPLTAATPIAAGLVNDSMFLASGVDPLVKYDGDNWYRGGLVRWQPGLFCTVDERVGSIKPIILSETYDAHPSTSKYEFNNKGDTAGFAVGDLVVDGEDNSEHIISSIVPAADSSDKEYIVIGDSTTHGGTTSTLSKIGIRSYYFRLNAIDANDNIIVSAVTGHQDYRVKLTAPCQVNLRMVGMPLFANYNYDRVELEIYSTHIGQGVAPFYLNQTLDVNFDAAEGYIDFVDTADDASLTQLDAVVTGLLGAELGTTWDTPPLATYAAATANRLILGNLRSDPQIDWRIRPRAGDAQLSDFIAKNPTLTQLLVRKDSTDTGTTSNMIDRTIYEFVNNGAVDFPTGAAIGSTMAISDDGTYLFLGSYEDATKGVDAGAVFIFEKVGTEWAFVNTIYASDATAGDRFGRRIDCNTDGSILVVGASKTSNGGKVYVYTEADWFKETRITGSDVIAGEDFGIDVAISSDSSTIVVGANDAAAGGVTRGAVYVYTGTDWLTETKLTASDSVNSDNWGSVITTNDDGSYILVGNPSNLQHGTDTGAAYLRWGGSTYPNEYKFAKLETPVDYDYFGNDVALSDDGANLAIASYFSDQDGNTNEGSVHVYKDIGSTMTTSTITHLVAGATHGLSTNDVLTLGSTATGLPNPLVAGTRYYVNVISSTSFELYTDAGLTTQVLFTENKAVYVYRRVTVLLPDTGDRGDTKRFGASVAFSADGEELAIGAPLVGTGGCVYVNTGVSTDWATRIKLVASVAASQDQFGTGLALTSDAEVLVAGAIGYDHGRDNSGSMGAAYILDGDGDAGTTEGYEDEYIVPRIAQNTILSGTLPTNQPVDWEFTDGESFRVSLDPLPAVGDWVYFYHAAQLNNYGYAASGSNWLDQPLENELEYAGWWQVASVETTFNTATFNYTGSLSPKQIQFNDAEVSANEITIGSLADDFVNNTRVYYNKGTGLLGGLTDNLPYYVVGNDGTGTIQLALTRGGAAIVLTPGSETGHILVKWHLPTHFCTAYTSGAVPVPVFQDYNYAGALNATILDQNTGSAGSVYESFFATQVGKRLTDAVNATQRQVDTSITGYEDFVPWHYANGGGNYGSGQCVFRFDQDLSTTPEIVLGTAFSQLCRQFVNGVNRTDGAEVSAISMLLPSRVAISYPNFPELFDAPFTPIAANSDSAVDINAADGEEITGLATFFGTSVFRGAHLSDSLIVFKPSSIYAVNVETRLVQRLETHGQGCTAPGSIASTARGITFANSNGIWRVNRDLSISYVGEAMEGRWRRGEVNLAELSAARGAHDDLNNRYQLSVPVAEDTTTSESYVYDHTREGKGQEYGAWTRWDNHDVTATASIDQALHWGTSVGEVMRYRDAHLATDYNDDGSAITLDIKYKPCAFGDHGRRKVSPGAVLHWVADYDTSGTSVETAVDLQDTFASGGSITTEVNVAGTSMGGSVTHKIQPLRHSWAGRRFAYLQLRVLNSSLNESVELAGVDFIVGGLNQLGIKQAGEA